MFLPANIISPEMRYEPNLSDFRKNAVRHRNAAEDAEDVRFGIIAQGRSEKDGYARKQNPFHNLGSFFTIEG